MDPADDFIADGECGGDGTAKVTLPIPNVVQKALRTRNIAQFSADHDDDTIYGLEGFLLPQYLSLRYKVQNCLEEGLRLAQEEEWRDRQSRQTVINNTRKPKKSKKKRKRKSTSNMPNNNREESRRKRRRKKRRKVVMESEELDDKTCNEIVDSNEMNHYRMMARIIVAPYTSSLIAAMNRCKKSSMKLNNADTSKDESASIITASDKKITNVYKNHNGTKSKQKCSLVPPQESLECIVDGAICALVRRTHKFRSVPASQKTVGKVNHRRRKRKSNSSQHQQYTRPEEACVHRNKKNTNANNWLLERNLLSSGYVLGNSDILASSPKKKINAQEHNHNQFLRGCPNMAPGIHCLQPNPLATYARSSELIQFLHSVVGDEALREILMNAVILIPAVSADIISDDNSTLCFDRCNYFQLCGPPLNTLAKRFEQIAKNISSVQQKVLSLQVRKRKREEMIASSNSETEQKRNYDGKRLKPTSQSHRDANKAIPRSNLFYCDFYTKHVGLSPQHWLNKQGDDDVINFQLLDSMVHIWPKYSQQQSEKKGTVHSNKRRKRWRRLRESGIAMCKEMRKRNANCDFSRLLEYHCPLPREFNSLDSKSALSHLVTLHTPVENVAAFIQALLRRAFPSSFWGSKRNFDQVVNTMTVYLNLRRAEAFPEKAVVSGIRVLDMKWLHSQQTSAKLSRTDHESVTVLVCNIMRWLYYHFINPILRSTFYITETEFSGTRVLYYRRPVWMRIRNFSLEMLLVKEQYREMGSDKAHRLLSCHNIGCPPAPLRILPKKTGIRAIAMLSKTCEIDNGAKKRSILSPPNKVMQSTFHALRYEHEKKPALFGAGVLGLTEVFPSFCSFVGELKQLQSRPGSSQKLFFTSSDIKHCYDTINQKRLFKLMRSMVEEEIYLTKDKFVLCSKGDNSAMRCMWKKTTCPPEKFSRSSPSNLGGQYSNAIFVDGVYCSIETNKTINGLLRDHIFGQVVVANGNFGPRYLHQRNGIPQGSILSSMFCNTYFGSLEEVLFENVFDKSASRFIRGNSSNECDSILVKNPNALHLLLRIVDDFLLISTDKNASIRFLEKLNVGIPSLGVKVNADKTRVNYSAPGRMLCDQYQSFFPWCGLLINTVTCEITLDYERFSGEKAIDTVSVYRLGSEGSNLRKAMKGFVRPRCNQQLLFSSRINSIDSVRLNFYQTFLLCAIKTIHYIDCIGTVSSSKKQRNFIHDSVCDTIQYTFLLISSKLKDDFHLCWGDAVWLGKRAFSHVLKTKTKRHKCLKDLFSESRELRCLNRVDLVNITKRAGNLFSLT
jgi:telomerase reverse transcriptase